MRILITGANGFIAKNLANRLPNHHIIDAASRQDLDLLNPERVRAFFKDRHYKLVIHTAVEGGRRTNTDNEGMVYRNLLMVYNLLDNQNSFDRMITFGSGAELDRRYNINTDTNTHVRYPIDYYGMSKSIINKLCQVEPKLYNFRIFNCFGPDESPDRLIRGNIEKYLRKEPMTLFSNRLMDFFYVEDLVMMVDYFMNTPSFPIKEVNCSYSNHVRLRDILGIINSLDEYTVPIVEMPDDSKSESGIVDTDYVGVAPPMPLKFIGLEGGIQKMYETLKGRL